MELILFRWGVSDVVLMETAKGGLCRAYFSLCAGCGRGHGLSGRIPNGATSTRAGGGTRHFTWQLSRTMGVTSLLLAVIGCWPDLCRCSLHRMAGSLLTARPSSQAVNSATLCRHHGTGEKPVSDNFK